MHIQSLDVQTRSEILTPFLIGYVSIGIQDISFLSNGDCCHLLITIPNSLGSDQDQQNVGPDMDPNCLAL